MLKISLALLLAAFCFGSIGCGGLRRDIAPKRAETFRFQTGSYIPRLVGATTSETTPGRPTAEKKSKGKKEKARDDENVVLRGGFR